MLVKSLPKSFRQKCGNVPFKYCSSYITNGHFAISKFSVKDSHRYCLDHPSAKLNEDAIMRIVPVEARFTYKRTNRLFDNGNFLIREFVCEEHFANEHKKAYFSEEYVKFFDVQELSGKDCFSPMVNEGLTLILMPCRNPGIN